MQIFRLLVKWHFYLRSFDPNHGLTALKICPIFNCIKNDIFIVQKASYWENNIMKRQHQDLLYKKNARGKFGIFKQNHGLTHLKKIWKIFDCSKMTFLSSKKHPFEKITSPNDKTKVFFYRKVILIRSKNIRNFWP